MKFNLELHSKVNHKSIFLLIIPLALSGFTHLWNPIGFPTMDVDEGIYMRRALHILEGLGPQESISYYDHPYFGPIFLAALFKIIGYPDSLKPSSDLHSIEMLFLIPKVLMGILAVVDTFLVYKISERRYSRNVAVVASVLFAVMPITWLLRTLFLDTILLPFLLTSILFAVSVNSKQLHETKGNYKKKYLSMVILSGVFLGLAIFTKATAFTMIPLVGFLVYGNSNKKLKTLVIWFIPVILIPLIWPAYAAYVGDFEKWLDGVSHQVAEREGHELDGTVTLFLKVDPVLLLLGAASIGYVAVIKRDLMPLLWIAPILFFFYFTHYSSLFHFIPVIPSLCIGAGLLIEDLSKRIPKQESRDDHLKYMRRLFSSKLPYIVIAGIAAFGFVSTTMLITTDIASFQSKAAAFVAGYVHDNDRVNNKNSNNTEGVRVIASPIYLWIFNYVFHIDSTFHYKDRSLFKSFPEELKPQKVVMMADEDFENYVDLERNTRIIRPTAGVPSPTSVIDNDVTTRWTSKNLGSWIESDLSTDKVICSMDVAWFKGNERSYNFKIAVSSDGNTFTNIFSGKSSGTTLSPETYNLKNVTAKLLKIIVNGNTANSYASIREINVYGYSPEKKVQSPCEDLPISHVKTGEEAKTPSGQKEKLLMLYGSTQSVVTFNGTGANYDHHQYPYTTMGYSEGGGKVDVRTNK